MQFERKKQLFAAGALVFGLALAGCGGDSGTSAVAYPIVSVDGSLGLSTATVASVDGAGQTLTLSGDGAGSAFRPAGTAGVTAGQTVAVVDGFASVLPGLSASTGDRPILLEPGDIITGLYLQTDGSITEGPIGTGASAKGNSPRLGFGDGSYAFRINGPLFVKNGGNVLAINDYFQVEFTVSGGKAGLPSRIQGSLPANGSPGAGLTLTTSGFNSVFNGGTESLSVRGTNANRDQDQTLVGGSGTFRFSGTSTFVTPQAGLNSVVYRANAGF